MATVEVRCTAPHPRRQGETCGAKLLVVVARESVTVTAGGAVGRKCVGVRCPRCGTDYAVRLP